MLCVLAAVLALASATDTRAEELGNAWCPVRPDESALSQFRSEHEGKAIHFCCKSCVATFNRDPAAYLAELPQFATPDPDRPAWRLPLDHAWNTGSRFPGIALGLLALAGIVAARACLALFPVSGWPRQALAAAGSARGLALLAVLALAVETFSAHRQRTDSNRRLAEKELEDWIHFATFVDYGDPPIPAPPEHSHRMEVTYFRGNDERSDLLFNGGFYRTATFDLSVCRADGAALFPGIPAPPLDDLFLRVRITRAPNTPDYFWTPERMGLHFATRESGRFLGRHAPVADALPLQTIEPARTWEFRYPLAGFASGLVDQRLAGIVYLCESRFDEQSLPIGARFHCGFQFDLDFADGRIQPASSVWMGSLYRSRILRSWQIPAREWLSTDPIPVIEDGHPISDDPDILGITGHENDQN